MTGLIVLTFVPLVVAIGFMIRMRSERKARLHAERMLMEIVEQQHGVGSREWFAVLAHELRSPVAAILGYDELLEDGTFGDLTPAALDATRRIRLAAQHLISLIEGLEHSSARNGGEVPLTFAAADLMTEAVAAVSLDAEGRGTTIRVIAGEVALHTRRTAAERALVLMLGAAIKASPDAELSLEAAGSNAPALTVRGSRLDPQRDGTRADLPLTGPAFRLQLARAAAAAAEGTIDLQDDGTVTLHLPRL